MKIDGAAPSLHLEVKKENANLTEGQDFYGLMAALMSNLTLPQQQQLDTVENMAVRDGLWEEGHIQNSQLQSIALSIENQREMASQSSHEKLDGEIAEFFKSLKILGGLQVNPQTLEEIISSSEDNQYLEQTIHNQIEVNDTNYDIEQNTKVINTIEAIKEENEKVSKETLEKSPSLTENLRDVSANNKMRLIKEHIDGEHQTHSNWAFEFVKEHSDDVKSVHLFPWGKIDQAPIQTQAYYEGRQNLKVDNTDEIRSKTSSDQAIEKQAITSQSNTPQLINETAGLQEGESLNTAVLLKQQDMAQIVTERFKALRLPEVTEIKVRLKPEDLGDILIKVTLEKGEIKGSIFADKKEAFVILQNQIDNIKQQLQNSNINLNSLNVFINYDGGNNQNPSRRFNSQNKKPSQSFTEIIDEAIDKREEGVSIIV